MLDAKHQEIEALKLAAGSQAQPAAAVASNQSSLPTTPATVVTVSHWMLAGMNGTVVGSSFRFAQTPSRPFVTDAYSDALAYSSTSANLTGDEPGAGEYPPPENWLSLSAAIPGRSHLAALISTPGRARRHGHV